MKYGQDTNCRFLFFIVEGFGGILSIHLLNLALLRIPFSLDDSSSNANRREAKNWIILHFKSIEYLLFSALEMF